MRQRATSGAAATRGMVFNGDKVSWLEHTANGPFSLRSLVSRDTYLPWWGRRFRLPSQLFPVPEYRRRLPHFHPNDSHLFLTWRLWGSLPSGTEKAAPHLTPGQAFAAVDHSLDRLASGPLWLKDQRIAKRVSHAVLIGADERRFYDLRAWVVMPNHVHLLILPLVSVPRLMLAEGIDGQRRKPHTE